MAGVRQPCHTWFLVTTSFSGLPAGISTQPEEIGLKEARVHHSVAPSLSTCAFERYYNRLRRLLLARTVFECIGVRGEEEEEEEEEEKEEEGLYLRIETRKRVQTDVTGGGSEGAKPALHRALCLLLHSTGSSLCLLLTRLVNKPPFPPPPPSSHTLVF